MRGVDTVKKEDGKIMISKYGIKLDLSEYSVLRIEKYDHSASKWERLKTGPSSSQELPDYLKYENNTQTDVQTSASKLQNLKARYKAVIRQLEKLEILEKKSGELQKKGRQKWSPRKARIARQEKARIDAELETLRKQEESLLEQKEKLEYQINSLE
jgi:hypothetical protein